VNRQKREELVKVALLIPTGDPIGKDFDRVPVFEGDENDVLSRYAGAAEEFRASHLVRVTGDCPLLRPFVISKAISLGVQANYSYLSNVDERCRTSPDGQDVEFMSRDMLDWLNKTASTAFHREHVTTFAREDPPRWAKRSVDTQEDLETVRRVYSDIAEKYQKACSLYPKHCIHRL
jgi:spore coat polysaccharide biosynthesis protein SpsF (cytidylyltransferase family)